MIAVGSLSLVLLAATVTTPLALGPVGVTGWFILLGSGLSAAVALAAYTLGQKFQPKQTSRKAVTVAIRRGSFIGGYITVNLSLSSLQQLNMRNILLLFLLLVLTEFYLVARA